MDKKQTSGKPETQPRTRYNPNREEEDKLSRSSQEFDFDDEGKNGVQSIVDVKSFSGAPALPTHANFTQLSHYEKAKHDHKYSNYYKSQK